MIKKGKRIEFAIYGLALLLIILSYIGIKRDIKGIKKNIEERIPAQDLYRSIPELSGLEEVQVKHGRFKVFKYEIDLTALDLTRRVKIPENWKPESNSKKLGERLPFDWGEWYKKDLKQFFNPHVFYLNALALCKYVPSTDEEAHALVRLKDELIDRFIEFTELQDGARYVIYTFDSTAFSGIKAPWVSGFAQGQALSALCHLYRRFEDDRYLKMAEEIWNSFTQYRDTSSGRFWVTEIDDSGFLWIEEYPLSKEPQPKVLNGHICGIHGLYNYFQLRPHNSDILRLLQGAITSVHRYVNYYRRPGKVNRYSLWDENPDYLPTRTVSQQNDLFQITNEPYFFLMAESFRMDFAHAESSK